MKHTTRAKAGPAGLLCALLVTGACSSSGSKAAAPTTAAGSSTASTAAPATSTSAVVVKSSRGFDGTTIKVAGLEQVSQFAGAEIGAEARFKRFNDTNEIPGLKIQFVEVADDKGDPATALSEVRRLVTQDNVFAIVSDFSTVNPLSYLSSQHVPYVGPGYDSTYCSATPTTSLWGFSTLGCVVPSHPPKMPDDFAQIYQYVAQKSGKANPTAALLSNDNQSGKQGVPLLASSAEGAGFDVVYAKGTLPTVVSDYTPYVQTWLTSNSGKAPDALLCELAIQCLQVWQSVKAAGYNGTFYVNLGPVAPLAKALAGTVTLGFYNSQPNPALTQMETDLQAFKAGTQPVGYANVPSYFAADMFIQALKKVGRDITPEAVQQALANQSWQIQGLVGPINYPASTVAASPACGELLTDDGTNYTVVAPFACSNKTYPVDPKFTG